MHATMFTQSITTNNKNFDEEKYCIVRNSGGVKLW